MKRRTKPSPLHAKALDEIKTAARNRGVELQNWQAELLLIKLGNSAAKAAAEKLINGTSTREPVGILSATRMNYGNASK